MDIFFYYLTFAFLTLQMIYSAFLIVASVLQLVKINRKSPRIEGANLFVSAQMLQAVVVLSVAILMLRFLQADIVSSWVMLPATGLLSLVDSLFRRYQNSRAQM